MNTADIAVLLFGNAPLPGPLAGRAAVRVDSPENVDVAVGAFRRLVVLGADADLALVLTRLLRADRLDIEVGYVAVRRSPATRIYRLGGGRRAARRAVAGAAKKVPLIRDETGTAIVGSANWLPAGDGFLRGEAVIDDTALFDGDVAGVRIEPTAAMPGLRATVLSGRWGRPRRWVPGRAAQLGTTGAVVIHDGVRAPRPTRRSTFYRHIEGWLLVR